MAAGPCPMKSGNWRNNVVADPHERPTATKIHDTIKHMLSRLSQERLNKPIPVPSLARTPSYSAEAELDEQCLVIHAHSLPQATGTFIVTSNNGNAKLRLTAQEDKIELPVYGTGGVVAGTIELTKTESISSVEVTVACPCWSMCRIFVLIMLHRWKVV